MCNTFQHGRETNWQRLLVINPGERLKLLILTQGQIIIIIINIFIIILKPTFKHSSNGVVVTMTIFIIHDN
jgi:hypothetical protein